MDKKPEIILTGAGGQLGLTLQELWPHSPLSDQYKLTPLTSAEFDITNSEAIAETLRGREIVAIINAAAYTAVDAAEESENHEQAFGVNEKGPAELSAWAAEQGVRLIHISTDFVFDGNQSQPYTEEDPTAPLGIYGLSKLAGEQAVIENMASSDAGAVVIRTSWLYSPFRNNFVKTILRLMAERKELSIVDDQIGSPTSAYSLGVLILRVLQHPEKSGVYHWCDGGNISWFDFAVAIQESALLMKLLTKEIALNPIPTSSYPTPAKRPAYSVLATSKAQQDFEFSAQDWQANLIDVMGQLAKQ